VRKCCGKLGSIAMEMRSWTERVWRRAVVIVELHVAGKR
jgi:hypothetical protein